MVEVYGAHNEYLKTTSAELIDELGDMAVYCAQVDLSELTQECSLKVRFSFMNFLNVIQWKRSQLPDFCFVFPVRKDEETI